MATKEDDAAPAFRFKRRKTTHVRKIQLSSNNVPAQSLNTPVAVDSQTSALTPTLHTYPDDLQTYVEGDDDATPNLKEILRQRKRPQDRTREVARKAAERKIAVTSIQQYDEPAPGDKYSGRFVAQTGQVVDKDDEQMAAYVEARLAEKNHRQYGWPIPRHLEGLVATLAPGERQSTSAPEEHKSANESATMPNPGRDTRLAAGLGKLQEIDLGPEAAARNLQRIEEARRRLEGIPDPVLETPPESSSNPPAKPPRRRRQPRRRNSEDERRDMMVEAVLREAKLEFFEKDKPPSPAFDGDEDADEAIYEQFRRDYENQESKNQRKPMPPPGAKGVKEPPKGPKLGGSRSARAAMRLQEEQAAKAKK